MANENNNYNNNNNNVVIPTAVVQAVCATQVEVAKIQAEALASAMASFNEVITKAASAALLSGK